jgi:hypothetical protein
VLRAKVGCTVPASTGGGGREKGARQADCKSGAVGAGDVKVFIVRIGALARRGFVVGHCMGRAC